MENYPFKYRNTSSTQIILLALPTSDHWVAGSNPAGDEILPEPKWRFIAQKWLKYCWKGRKTLSHPSIQIIFCIITAVFWSLWSRWPPLGKHRTSPSNRWGVEKSCPKFPELAYRCDHWWECWIANINRGPHPFRCRQSGEDSYFYNIFLGTIMILNFWTDRSRQAV